MSSLSFPADHTLSKTKKQLILATQRQEFVLVLFSEAFKYSIPPTNGMVVNKTEEEWKQELGPDRYKVLRKKGTERPFTGQLLHNEEKGVYTCGGCGTELFSSESKYDSGSGWPSFWTAMAKDKIKEIPDNSLWMKRMEVVCANCGGHLGHVFDDGPQPTGLRYCVNSMSLGFKKNQNETTASPKTA